MFSIAFLRHLLLKNPLVRGIRNLWDALHLAGWNGTSHRHLKSGSSRNISNHCAKFKQNCCHSIYLCSPVFWPDISINKCICLIKILITFTIILWPYSVDLENNNALFLNLSHYFLLKILSPSMILIFSPRGILTLNLLILFHMCLFHTFKIIVITDCFCFLLF